MPADELQAEWDAEAVDTARERNRRTAGEVEGRRKAQDAQEDFRVGAIFGHARQIRYWDWHRRHKQKVDVLEERGEASRKVKPLMIDFAELHRSHSAALIDELNQRRAVFGGPRWISLLVSDRSLDRAERYPAA